MNFEFSEDQTVLRDHSRRFLSEAATFDNLRKLIDSDDLYDKNLWQQMVELGWTALTIPEEFGGMGLGALELCVMAEEAGRVLAPVPFFSTICVGAETLKHSQHAVAGELLGRIAGGEVILAADLRTDKITLAGDKASGAIAALAYAEVADYAVLSAPNAVLLVDLNQAGVTRGKTEHQFDELIPLGTLTLNNAAVTVLSEGAAATALIDLIVNQAAVLTAFEQIGAADTCCTMGRDYVMDRYAFGRPLAGYQAVKHKLADVMVKIELARSNAYFGAWAMNEQAPELPLAAAVARVSATEAFNFAAEENLQVHGGIGYTFEANCHFFYKRARVLATSLGHFGEWCERLLAAAAKAA
jgi:acyl-CoA dehydrogenase